MARPKVELEESGFKSSPNRRSLSLRLPRAASGSSELSDEQVQRLKALGYLGP